ncbi:MAG: peptidylprolyl isomerase [Longimicrobiales bacterium]|nr:peptidylprolyl isomerase [Longimicrobiales bacterium]
MTHRIAPLSALLLLLGTACAPPDPAPLPPGEPEGRPEDALLERPDLQRIVELGLARDGAALAAYLDPVAHPDPTVRARAAFTLGSVQDTALVELLVGALHDLDARVRADVAFALGQLPVSGVATPLFNVLKVEWDARAQAAQLEAVGKRCEEGAALRLFQIGDPGLQPGVARAMGRCVLAGVAVDTLLGRLAHDLAHPDPAVREWAAYPFGRHPEPEVWRTHLGAVAEALTRLEADDRAAAHLLRAVGRASDARQVRSALWWLRNGARWQTRVNAAEALAALAVEGSARAAEGLPDGLDDASVHVRLRAAQGMAGVLAGFPALADRLAAWLDAHPGDVAPAGAVLSALGQAGRTEPVAAWFERQDLDRDGVLLAGVAAAAALPGRAGETLLRTAAARADSRAGRQAARILAAAPFAADTTPAAGDASADDEGEAEGGAFPPPPPYRAISWAHLRDLGPRPRLHLLTERGEVVLELRSEFAPLTVDAIASTAREGRFDGIPFHRVIPNFVAQGGDVTLGGARPGAGFRLRSEFTRLPYREGTLGMASAGKDTESTQFFVTHSPQPHLDGAYTAFGRVVRGTAVLAALAPEDRIVRAWVVPGAL